MTAGFFITGTDTGIGKTTVALGLMAALQKKGVKVAAMKPVSAGCVQTSAGLRNEDALLLMKQSSVEIPYDTVNPYAFEAAIAPHIAAEQQGITMQMEPLINSLQNIKQQADLVIAEGAGGWLVPFNENETMADVAKSLGLPVILVVGMRLGCLNHALLTQLMIQKMDLKLAGWIANYVIADFDCAQENQYTLEKRLDAPLLGAIPYQEKITLDGLTEGYVSDYLDVSKLMQSQP